MIFSIRIGVISENGFEFFVRGVWGFVDFCVYSRISDCFFIWDVVLVVIVNSERRRGSGLCSRGLFFFLCYSYVCEVGFLFCCMRFSIVDELNGE